MPRCGRRCARSATPAGHALLGVSNVGLHHLRRMMAAQDEVPAFVQNRCFAVAGWDRDVRQFCREREHRVPGLLAADGES